MQLKGKVVFITGGSRGIGKSIVLKFANEGARVAFTYSKSDKEAQDLVLAIEKIGGEILALKADSSNASKVVDAVTTTIGKMGPIDILINNAGIFELANIVDTDLESFDRTMSINVKAVFAATMEAAKKMPNGGRIITIGSVNAELIPFEGGALYGMSKAAVQMLTKGVARDLAARKITANTIQPGPINTDMNPSDIEKNPMATTMANLTALKNYGTSDDVAEFALFIASARANNITGAALNIDGGFTI